MKKSLFIPKNEHLAEISEVFSSFQGEGPYLGTRQIFIRFGRCNCACVYCDEHRKMQRKKIRMVSAGQLMKEVLKLEAGKGPHASVSLTGGEPLCYTGFLMHFLPLLRKRLPIYLETNGTLPYQLCKVIRWCDVIAMDMKLPSSGGGGLLYKEHEAFLKTANQKRVLVKVVVTPLSLASEIQKCVAIVQRVNKAIPFVLQPVSGKRGVDQRALDLIVRTFFKIAKEKLVDVRLIPQMHKIWGVR